MPGRPASESPGWSQRIPQSGRDDGQRNRSDMRAGSGKNGAMPAVRRLAARDTPAVAAIVVALPDYFTGEVAGQVERDCARHGAWVLTDSDEVAGFAVAQRKSAGGAEILWMAVAPGRRGRGNGTMLLSHVLDDLASAGIRLVEVKTLDRSAGYPPYEATCAFWERRDFIQLDTIDPLPGWEPGSPAAIYVAALRDRDDPGLAATD